jgi:hypothetical protein
MGGVVVGGPWYRSQLDVRTMGSIVNLVSFGAGCGFPVRWLMMEDGPIDLSRSRLITRAIAAGADWLVSLDADCSLVNPSELFVTLAEARRSEVALVGVPCPMKDGRWNVIELDSADARVAETSAPTLREVACVGTGIVAFRLGWYVKHWPSDRIPYFQSFVLPDRTAKGGYAWLGEDFGHCNAVRKLGGKVLADGRVRVEHHMSRAGSHEARL